MKALVKVKWFRSEKVRRWLPTILLSVVLLLTLTAFTVMQVPDPPVDPGEAIELTAEAKSIIQLLSAFVAGALGSWPANWFKNKLGVTDVGAFMLVVGLSAGISILGLWIAGGLAGLVPWTWQNVLVVGQAVFLGSQFSYQLLKRG